MPILLIKERAVVNFVRNQHLLKYIFFFFGGSAGGAKSQNIYHISFCIFCTLSNMNYLFTCTNYFIFCLQMGVYGNLEVLLYPAGWVWRFWVCTSSPVGSLWVLVSKFREEGMKPVSSLILRRGVQPILFHQQSPSYVCSIITPQRRRGVPFPLLCISLPSACSSKAGSNLGLRFPTVEGNSTASKAQ